MYIKQNYGYDINELEYIAPLTIPEPEEEDVEKKPENIEQTLQSEIDFHEIKITDTLTAGSPIKHSRSIAKSLLDIQDLDKESNNQDIECEVQINYHLGTSDKVS